MEANRAMAQLPTFQVHGGVVKPQNTNFYILYYEGFSADKLKQTKEYADFSLFKIDSIAHGILKLWSDR